MYSVGKIEARQASLISPTLLVSPLTPRPSSSNAPRVSDAAAACGPEMLTPLSQDKGRSPGVGSILSPQDQAALELSALQPWIEMITLFQNGLEALAMQGLPHIIAKCLLKQVLGFIDAQVKKGDRGKGTSIL